MSKRNVFVWLGIVILLAIGAVYFWQSVQNEVQEVGQGRSVENMHTSLPTKPMTTGSVFQNDFIKVTVPVGWHLIEATTTLQDQIYDKNTSKTTKVGKPQTTKNGAVSITKGNYILYINPNAGQASGVEGGRFNEIAGGAPSADAVVIDRPSPPCGEAVVGANFAGFVRKDLFVNSANKQEYCTAPKSGKTVWYFSYITDARGGYFNYYRRAETRAYVITMAYNSKSPEDLPEKGSAGLAAALGEMTDILHTLELKNLAK